MKNNFFAMLSRMKYINRWGLMRNTMSENIAEHSLDVAIIAHGLATISNLYFGGKVDIVLQRFIEIWDSMPQMFVLIIVASIFVPSFTTLLCVLLLFSWTELTSMVRAEFLRARNFEYVKAAKAMGVGHFRIMVRHILPNALVSSITFLPFIFAGGIVALSALDFLGLGLGQNYPSLGDLIRQGKDNLHAPWIGLSIFFVLSLMLSVLIFIGEGVRDAWDKKK